MKKHQHILWKMKCFCDEKAEAANEARENFYQGNGEVDSWKESYYAWKEIYQLFESCCLETETTFEPDEIILAKEFE